jgi:hypothetical protein
MLVVRKGVCLAAFAYLICMLASRCVRVGGVLGKSVVGMESWEVLVLCLKTAARCLEVEGQAVTWVSLARSLHIFTSMWRGPIVSFNKQGISHVLPFGKVQGKIAGCYMYGSVYQHMHRHSDLGQERYLSGRIIMIKDICARLITVLRTNARLEGIKRKEMHPKHR